MTSLIAGTQRHPLYDRLTELCPIEKMDLNETSLIHEALARKEGELSSDGAFVAVTGTHTGRSSKDKYIVNDELTKDTIWWDSNKSLSIETFDRLFDHFLKAAQGKSLYTQHLFAGADPSCQLGVKVVCEEAWHALFIRHLLRRPQTEQLASFKTGLTIIDLPSLSIDPEAFGLRSSTVIACDFRRGIILIGGTRYAGEIKKSVFSFLNFLLPADGILPMHCSANVSKDGDSAIFFGLSGTGKTTLSADPERFLIGDDEHGWSREGIFNFEGGCYAKTIKLSRDGEPEIYAAARRAGSVLENIILKPETREPDFDDVRLTDNTRCAYPLEAIPNSLPSGRSSHPKHIVMLTADAFGALPAISRLTPEQAVVYFLSGYTAKVAGTERGVTEPEATFSACFGAPFMPRSPMVYGTMLREKIKTFGATCWLLNTGWTGGPYGIGKRMPLAATRALLNAALQGNLDKVSYQQDPIFGLSVPLEGPAEAVPFLDARATWSDGAAYDQQARKLARMFCDNFDTFAGQVEAIYKEALPKI